jgi:hypothetical protein
MFHSQLWKFDFRNSVNRPPEGDLRLVDHHSQLGIIPPSSYANEGAEKLMGLGMILGMVS